MDIIAISEAFVPKGIEFLPNAKDLGFRLRVYFLNGLLEFKAPQAFCVYLVDL